MQLKFWFTTFLVVLAFGLAGTAFAFHSGGVADCAGCHAMHNTHNASSAAGGPMLLTGTDQSSTCLNCHSGATLSSYHSMTWPFAGGSNVASIPANRSPGGDFAWLTMGFTNTGHAAAITGQEHGHSIVAIDFGLTADTTKTVAPGGTFPANALYCNSCHDPHNKMRRDNGGNIVNMISTPTANLPIIASGSYPASVPGIGTDLAGKVETLGVTSPGPGQAVGVYRILAGYSTYKAAGQTIPYGGVPMAIAPATYNQTEATNQVRVAYGTGTGTNQVNWGAWCATCHTSFVNGVGSHFHPVDSNAVLSGLGNEQGNYNAYIGSGNMGGVQATAYLSLVPFVTGSSDVKKLASLSDNGKAAAAKVGADQQDQASCLTCHRAHASGWRNALRWNTEGEFITFATSAGVPTWPGTDTTSANTNLALGMTSQQVAAAYYDRTVVAKGNGATSFSPFQRSLCNKCHAQD